MNQCFRQLQAGLPFQRLYPDQRRLLLTQLDLLVSQTLVQLPPLSSSSITPSSQDSTATDTPPSLTPSLKSDSTTSTASEGGEQFHSMATFPVTALFHSGTETKGYEDSTLPLWSSSVATQGGPSQRTSSSSSSSSSSHFLSTHR
jgi:hypothetical protein